MGSITTTFAYDGDGKRVKKSETNGSTVTTTVYIGNIMEKVFIGGVVTDTVKYYYASGKRIGMRRAPVGGSETLSYMFADHLGGTSVVLNASTGTTSTVNYYPFGARRQSTGDLQTDRLFTGQKLDGTGLYDFGARQYDPSTGRFLSPDTVVPNATNPQALNRYAYGYNNPARFVDDSGHVAWIPLLIIGAVIASKGIDYGWTAWDMYESARTLADRSATNAERSLAGLNIALAVGMEAAEPDDVIPVGVPADDVARRGIIKTARDALVRGDDTAWKLLPDWMQPVVRGMATQIKVLDKLGIKKNGKTVQGVVGNDVVDTIPDILTETIVGEIKDVKKLGWERQIRAQYDYATRNGKRYTLYIRKDTELQGNLKKLVDDKEIDVKYIDEILP